MAKKTEVVEVVETDKLATNEKYTKNIIMNSETVRHNRDLLFSLLDDEKEYTLGEVDKLVDEFNKKEVN